MILSQTFVEFYGEKIKLLFCIVIRDIISFTYVEDEWSENKSDKFQNLGHSATSAQLMRGICGSCLDNFVSFVAPIHFPKITFCRCCFSHSCTLSASTVLVECESPLASYFITFELCGALYFMAYIITYVVLELIKQYPVTLWQNRESNISTKYISTK